MLMPVLNTVGIEEFQFLIISAEPKTSSGGTRGSASTAGVLVDTTNCGKLHVSTDVSFDNRDQVAEIFVLGAEYEFSLGWFSRVVTKKIRREVPSVQDCRLVK